MEKERVEFIEDPDGRGITITYNENNEVIKTEVNSDIKPATKWETFKVLSIPFILLIAIMLIIYLIIYIGEII